MAKAPFDNNDLNLKATELRLGLPGTTDSDQQAPPSSAKAANNKRSSPESDSTSLEKNQEQRASSRGAPPPKTQVVGWPPVRSYRKKNTLPNKSSPPSSDASGLYLKVSMDGAPYLRKIDLRCFKNYSDLLEALEDMFGCSIGACSEGEGHGGTQHAPTYEDRDGDWMLVGDVPWDMFLTSCRRLRIMKGSEVRDFGRL